MVIFDLAQEREIVEGPFGYAFSLKQDFEETKHNKALSHAADLLLGDAVQCLLIHYDAPAIQLVEKALDWIAVAIREEERGDDDLPGGPEQEWYSCRAMGNWLLHSIQDKESLARFVHYGDVFMTNPELLGDGENVSLTLPSYVDAGAHQNALDRFAEARALLPPTSLNLIRNEGQMCYVICRHRLGLQYSEPEVNAAIARFLKKNVNTWLLDGHYTRAALWMKIVHWREGKAGISPKEAILKCYDYLPTPTSQRQK